MACEHLNFKADVSVGRITQTEGGSPAHFTADIKVSCDECGMPFRFLCPDTGLMWNKPTIEVGGLELRAPIHPNDGTEPLPPKIRGYSITGIGSFAERVCGCGGSATSCIKLEPPFDFCRCPCHERATEDK